MGSCHAEQDTNRDNPCVFQCLARRSVGQNSANEQTALWLQHLQTFKSSNTCSRSLRKQNCKKQVQGAGTVGSKGQLLANSSYVHNTLLIGRLQGRVADFVGCYFSGCMRGMMVLNPSGILEKE